MSVNFANLLPQGTLMEDVAPGQNLLVRPLTMEHIAVLIQAYENDVREMLTAKEPDFTRILLASPALAANLIAMATDAVGQEDTIRKLPAATQVNILLTVWEVSVPDTKKLLSRLEKLVGDIRVAQVELAAEKRLTSSSSSQPASSD